MNGPYSINLVDDKKSLALQFRQIVVLVGLLIFLVTFLVYTPVLNNDFVNWDDTLYVVENQNIRSLDLKAFYWMFTTFHAGFWFPLTWFSHALDYALWGLNPRMHHLMSIILHGFNTLLVFLLVLRLFLRAHAHHSTSFSKMSKSILPQSLIVGSVTALLFGLHPLRVESVAWAAERKDLLCACFVFLSLLSYLIYTTPGHQRRRLFWFTLSLFLFILALMSKPMAVTLPVIILIIDFYPLKRFKGNSPKKISVLLEKVPFFILSMLFGILTIVTQKAGGAVRNLDELYFTARFSNALKSIVFYMIKMIWPTHLVPFYRLPNIINPLDPQYLLSAIVVLAITGVCVWMLKREKPLWLTAWLYYLVTLFPVVGIIQVGLHSAADRFTYLPSLSLTLLLGLGIARVWSGVAVSKHRIVYRGVILLCTCSIITILSCFTVTQIKLWHNSNTMWSAVIKAFPEAVPEAYYGLGLFYYEEGRLDEAVSEFKHAIALSPNYVPVHHNLGNVYVKKGMIEEAISKFKRAIALGSTSADLHNNLGGCYALKGRLDKAISEFKRVVALKPDFENAYINLGLAYYRKGELDKAISAYKEAISINDNTAWAHYNLAKVYYDKMQYQLAIKHCDRSIILGYNVPIRFLNLIKPYLN